MFISIDHGKRPSDYKIHLAKPNKEIIAVLHEKHNSTLNLRLGNIFELNFSIPYFIENNDLQMVNNPNVEKIKELMYLKLTWGELEEWFLIDNITESSEDNEIMNVQAFSIGYEHKRKRISEFNRTAINATEFYEEVLKDSPWTIGEIDSSFNLLYRSFDESGTDRFELIKIGAETFGGVIVWDTHNKKISLREPDNIGKFRGLIVNYDRLMTSLNKTRTTDEMVTRLYVYGNERITIENKNPTNEKYIEDYSYFMQPFKRDANKNVITHSDYMSDELCHALLDNQELRVTYEPQIKTLQGAIETKNASLSQAMIDLSNAEFTLMTAKGLLDIAKAVNDVPLINQRKSEVSNAELVVNSKKSTVSVLENELEVLQNQITSLQNAISIRSFNKELIDELEPYIIEKEIEDARYIDEAELFEFAKDKFSEIREPRVVIETGIEGLMNSVEEQYYWDKLTLGDTMQVKQKRMGIDYKSKIIEIYVNLDDSDVKVKIANFTENVDNLDKFISILYSSESNSTILNNNKYKWDSVVDIRDEVTQLRESEIDATAKRITAGVNESVEIGDRGIVITTPSFPNEMIIMQAGVIALSEDGGNNWKTSVTPRGVIADTIIGKLVASNNLIVTNDSGSMVLDGTGLTVDADSIKIMSGGSNPKNIIEDWNNMIIDMDNFADDNVLTPYEKSQVLHQWNMINDAHTKLIESFIDNMGNETDENPYPLEYDIYLETYERFKNFLFLDKQSDGYSMLDSSRMQFVSPVSSESYRATLTNYMTAKDDFILVIPMEYTNASIRVLEEGIFLEYVKSDELVASLNLSEEGVRIDGKLLSINSETRFRDDVVMDAGVIKSADNAIRIDLNAGTIDLARPLTINAVPVATKEDIENIEMTYTPVLSNDTANIPTDENGNNGNYYTANTEITIYQQSKDDTSNWTITADKSTGITGSLSGNKYTVTNMTTNVGYVDLIAKKSGKTLVKRFTLAKAKDGQSGRIPPMLSLSSTGQIMTFDSGNNPTPSSQEIQVVAKVNNYEGQVSWKIEKFNGNSLVETLTPTKNSQNIIMINQSVMTGNITSVRVTAYDLTVGSSFSDYITIYKLKESMDGVGIESITEYYLATSQSTGVTSSTSGFTTTIQTMTDVNRYLWNYEKIKYTDGTDKNTVPVIIGVHGQKGGSGEDGRSISSITEHYLATSLESGVSRGTSGWTTTMQQTDDTKRYLWNYETINWNKAPLTTYVEPVIIGVHGKKGEDGYTPVKGTDYFDGKDGANGTSSYLWVMYSQNANGNPMVDSPTNAKYIGVATTTTNTKPTAYSAYKWSLVKGTDGVNGEKGANGETSYLHIKYSNDGGNTFTANNGETVGDWIGTYVDFTEADSTLVSKYTWNKVKGEDGSNAKLLYLSATSETMTFNSDNTPNPATQTISFTANLQNTTGTATFTAIPYNGTSAMTAITLGGSGNTRTLTQSQFPATATRIEIKAVLGGLSDTVSVVKLKNGATGGTGAKGDNSIVGYLTNESVTLGASSTGVVSSFATASGTFRVFDGITEVTTNSACVFSLNSSTGVTVTINSSGVYTVTAMSADTATAEFKAVYKGVTITKSMSLSKSRVGVKGETGDKGSDGISPIVGFLTNESITLPATDTGAVSSFTGATGTLNVYEGTALKNAQATYSVVSPSNITVSITQSGVYTVSAMTTGTSVLSGTATLRAVYGGVTVDKILVVTKALRGTQGQAGATGSTGATGSSATSYWVTTSNNVIKKDVQNNIVPTSVTFSGFQKVGTNNPTSYSGRFIISTSVNGKDYTNVYTSSSNQTTYVYTVPKDVNFIKARLYQSGGTSILLDEQTIPVLVDAEGIDKKYEGQSLLDKTEILSGVGEVFTDQADDDSIVHVDIDGKSVGGGSGKNLFNPKSIEAQSTAYYGEEDNSLIIKLIDRRATDILKIANLNPNTTYVFTFSEPMNDSFTIPSTSKVWSGNNTTLTFVTSSGTDLELRGKFFPVSQEYPRKVLVQLEEGSTATEYEPPAPTPDYPIAIHSVNDFDVVSSVGRRNYLSIDKDHYSVGVLRHEGNGILSNITSNSSMSFFSMKKLSVPTGKIYTVSFEVMVLDSAIQFLNNSVYINGVIPNSVHNRPTLVANEWVKVYTTFDYTIENTSSLHIYFNQGLNLPTDKVKFRHLKVEEGTTATPYTPVPEDITENSNDTTINKTNILLSEPLRSVGDVKDRLFRDSDGLWKVERNIGETTVDHTNTFIVGASAGGWKIDGDTIPFYGYGIPNSNYNHSLTDRFPTSRGSGIVNSDSEGFSSGYAGFYIFRINKNRLSTIDPSGFRKWLETNPVTVQYVVGNPTIETLDQELQDKLNNIASYKDSNYVYTIVDKTNILPEYVRDNLKPTLHATFKGGGWYTRFKTEQAFNQTNQSVDDLKNETIPALKDGLLNSSEKEAVKQSLNVVSADKKGIDTQYTTVYANTALTGTAKTNLNSAKVALNTAFTNLQSAINAVLGVEDGTRITTAQMMLVTTRLNEYGTALSTYHQRYEQAQDAISTEKKRLADAYALAQAELAETEAKAYADGKISAEEKRAIQDAKDKLAEAQSHAQGLVDGLEIGGVNLINKGDIRSGRYINESTATLPSHVDYDTSGYLPVTPGREYIISAKMLYQVRVVYFDSSYSYISGILYSGNQGTSKIIVPPSNSSFVRMCGNKKSGSPLSTWMFEKGNKASTYKESPQDENRAGRNLLLDTSDFWEDYSVASGSFTTNVRRVEFSEMGLSVGDKFTVQVDLKCTNANNGVRLRVEQYKSGSDRISTYSQAEWLNYGVQRHVVTETVLADKPILNIYIAPEVTPVPSGTSVPFSVRRIMVEKGDVASAYSQAPEDIQEELDNKANQDDLSSVEGSLNNLYTVVNDLDVQTVKDQLAEYQEILSGVQSDSVEAKDQLDRILSEENGALAIINTILDKFNERWTTLDGFIEINSSETALSISKGNTNMVIDSDSLTFYSGRTPVATITNQYMKIDRGIFVESMQVGRHLWAPSKDNRDHFVLSYSGDAPV